LGSATRVTFWEARRAFTAGDVVIVTENDEGSQIHVWDSTTTHDRTTTTWTWLAEQVRTWRNRYPRQRFYIVEHTDTDGCTCGNCRLLDRVTHRAR
jgi:hypothetical protein